jgi:hypothetical protein
MAKAIKKAQTGTVVKSKPAKRYQTPADFYPESYEKRFPRTPGGGDNYETTIQMEKEQKARDAKRDNVSKVAVKKSPMKKGGMIKKAANGASLKPVPAGKPGLKKLPTPVRNKMGFQKNGGKVKK